MKPCFPSVPFFENSQSQVRHWIEQYQNQTIVFEKEHEAALSRLLPLLVCGEQSAQWVFFNEHQRNSQGSHQGSEQAFERIVADEQLHEMALALVQRQLPKPSDLPSLKRRSQHFYLEFGHQITFMDHFAQVACLDALVCRIMLAIERGELGAQHPFTLLCRMIKQDEARHVSASKHYALELGFDHSAWPTMRGRVADKLHQLLESERAAFEVLGVDLDWVFKGQGEP